MGRSRFVISVTAVVWVVATRAVAADLPRHAPLRVLIVSDSVNPHGLADPELTQHGDLAPAISDPLSGLHLAANQGVVEVDSQCVDTALAALAEETPNVVVYFAHRSARGCGGEDREAELVNAMRAHLVRGGGVVVFHHGLYEAPGKAAMLQLLGGAASSLSWEPTEGQRIVNVAPGHFITTQGLMYPSSESFGDHSLSVPAGSYASFTNLPDERYPDVTMFTEAGETRTLLFAGSDGQPRITGYELAREGWAGRVVFYQPGEYQPNALDPNGINFQILANALIYLGGTLEPEVGVEVFPTPDAGSPDPFDLGIDDTHLVSQGCVAPPRVPTGTAVPMGMLVMLTAALVRRRARLRTRT